MSNITKVNFGIKVHKKMIITSSRNVAKVFGKRHDHVLRDIENIISQLKIEPPNHTNLIPQNWGANFIPTTYKSRGKEYPEFLLTKKAFSLITFGFTGTKALIFKTAYIDKFEEMERQLSLRQAARMEFPELTEAIKALHDEPQTYHYSNETNMINKIVLGMTAKQYKEANGIDLDEKSIRDYLDADQIYLIHMLQRYDTALAVAEPDYYQRKKLLADYHEKLVAQRQMGLLTS